MSIGSTGTVGYHQYRVNESSDKLGHSVRIAMLSTMDGYYGGEVHLAGLAAGLHDRGHQVTCIVRPGSQLEERLLRQGLTVVALPLVDWFDLLQVARLGRRLRQLRVDILHTHMPRDYYISAAATVGTDIANVGTRHQLFPIALPLLKRPFLGRFAAMIAVSEAVRASLIANRALDSSRVFTVPNGMVLAPGRNLAEPLAGPLRMACGAVPGDPVVGFVGNLCPTKGVETLVQAAYQLRKSWPRLKVCIIGQDDGNGDYLQRLEGMVNDLQLKDVIHFLGYRDDAKWAAREFNIQVLTSQAEPFGLVTLEAMAQARPVVVTSTGGSPEIVRDGVEGFLFRPGDVSQLTSRLDVLLDSPGLCREMGLRGRGRVERDFTLEQMLDRTEGIYRQAVGLPASDKGRFSA